MSSAAGSLIMVLAGAGFSQQAPLNRGLGRATGPLGAAFLNFAVGGTILFLACAIAGELAGVGRIGPEWWHALGGCLAATYVVAGVLVVRTIGASGIAAGTITGQLVSSVGIDAGGLLGVDQRPLGVWIVIGAVGVLSGTFLLAGDLSPGGDVSTPRGRPLLPLLAIAGAGVLVGIQAPLNGLLSKSTGDLAAGLVNFGVGGATLAVALVLSGSVRGLAGVRRVRWFYLGGGVVGAVNAFAALALVERIGAGAVAAAAITGQMLASLAIDRAGVFGLEPRPLTSRRLLGAVLLVAGTVIFVG